MRRMSLARPRLVLGVLLLAPLLTMGACRPRNPAGDLPEADFKAELQSRNVAVGKPVEVTLRTVEGPGVTVSHGGPSAEGLTARLENEKTEEMGDHRVTTQTWSLEGPPGSYVIDSGKATVQKPQGQSEPIVAPPLFVDVGVKGPSSKLEDIASLTPAPPSPWPWWAAGGLVAALLLVAAAWWWTHRRKKKTTVPPEAAHVVALREWRAVMDHADLDDHTRALRLSEVFRRYLEARHALPATAWASGEILDALYDRGKVAALQLDQARRLLLATDLLKFARKGGGKQFFIELEESFQSYLAATRPSEPVPGAPGSQESTPDQIGPAQGAHHA
jgi:hypothetical protein